MGSAAWELLGLIGDRPLLCFPRSWLVVVSLLYLGGLQTFLDFALLTVISSAFAFYVVFSGPGPPPLVVWGPRYLFLVGLVRGAPCVLAGPY